MATHGVQRDLYRVLKVSRNATTIEIKEAYRRLAMELHPDRNDGCEKKAKDFKDASEAYNTLSDKAKRNAYDREIMHYPNWQHGYVNYTKQSVNERTERYRKVYAPRPPPGFKIFDHEKHFRMHYGDGFMDEEIERMRKRAQQAGGNYFEYESPLGEGFTMPSSSRAEFSGGWVKQGKKMKSDGLEYESAYYYDPMESEVSRRKRAKETIKERMKERRRNRPERAKISSEDDGCIIM